MPPRDTLRNPHGSRLYIRFLRRRIRHRPCRQHVVRLAGQPRTRQGGHA
jgi:hypothetical protein